MPNSVKNAIKSSKTVHNVKLILTIEQSVYYVLLIHLIHFILISMEPNVFLALKLWVLAVHVLYLMENPLVYHAVIIYSRKMDKNVWLANKWLLIALFAQAMKEYLLVILANLDFIQTFTEHLA